ncbi:hypothetical protein [Sphingobacterium sp. CZ-UAM]|nr:hypothetical protein [Sphingobacterium sp. CZ-UAM]
MKTKQEEKAVYVIPVINSYRVEMEEGIAAGSGAGSLSVEEENNSGEL